VVWYCSTSEAPMHTYNKGCLWLVAWLDLCLYYGIRSPMYKDITLFYMIYVFGDQKYCLFIVSYCWIRSVICILYIKVGWKHAIPFSYNVGLFPSLWKHLTKFISYHTIHGRVHVKMNYCNLKRSHMWFATPTQDIKWSSCTYKFIMMWYISLITLAINI